MSNAKHTVDTLVAGLNDAPDYVAIAAIGGYFGGCTRLEREVILGALSKVHATISKGEDDVHVPRLFEDPDDPETR